MEIFINILGGAAAFLSFGFICIAFTERGDMDDFQCGLSLAIIAILIFN